MHDEVSFTDADGLTWTVYEVPTSRVVFGDELVEDSASHLTFELVTGSRMLLKRLRDYPENWRELPPADLDELCTQAGPTSAAAGEGESDEIRRRVEDIST